MIFGETEVEMDTMHVEIILYGDELKMTAYNCPLPPLPEDISLYMIIIYNHPSN